MNLRKFYNLASVYFMVIFFKISGLAPLKVSYLRKSVFMKPQISFSQSLPGSIYNVALSLPILNELVMGIIKFSSFAEKGLLMLWVSLSILWVTPIILMYFCLKQKKLIEILRKLIKLEYELIDNFNRSVSRKYKSLTYEIALFVPQILFAVLHTWIITTKTKSHGLFVIVTSGVVINNLILLYALFIYYINKRFDFMNELLLSIASDNEKSDITFLTRSSQNEMTLKTLVLIREQQRHLYQVCNDLSKFFSWPILLAVVLFSVRLIFYSFSFTKKVFFCTETIDYYTLINEPVTLTKEIFVIVVLATHMTQLTLEIQKTGEIIYKIMDVYSMHRGIQSELEQFSIEVLHRRIPNSVFGLFTIDGSLVTSIARSTITYLVILIQFGYHKKTVNLPGNNSKQC